MDKIRLGFVPCHRYPCDEDWAVEMRQRCLKALRAHKSIDVVVPSPGLGHNGLVRDDASAQAAIDLFAQRGVQGVLLGAMSYGDELAAAAVAEALNVPVAVFSTREGAFSEQGTRRSDAFGGAFGITAALARRKIPYDFLGTFWPEDEAFSAAVTSFARTCAVADGLAGARIGLLGTRSERSEVGMVNEAALLQRLRVRVVPLELSALLVEAGQLAEDDHHVVTALRDMGREANCSACDSAALTRMARLELSMARLFAERGLAALAVSCANDAQERYGVAFCSTMARLGAAGQLAACQADVYGALTLLIQHLAALKASLPMYANWTIQHQDMRNVFLAWNCGSAPVSLAADPKAVQLREQVELAARIGADKAQGALEFQLAPGVVTLCRLAERDGQFRMLIATGEIIPSDDVLRGAWGWVRVLDLERLARVWAEQGFPPQMGLVYGDLADAVQAYCRYAGIDVVRVHA